LAEVQQWLIDVQDTLLRSKGFEKEWLWFEARTSMIIMIMNYYIKYCILKTIRKDCKNMTDTIPYMLDPKKNV